jgi:hypothetical protein
MIFAGRANRGLADRSAAILDRDDRVGPLVSIKITTLLLSQTGGPTTSGGPHN